MRLMGHVFCVSFVSVLVKRRGSSQLQDKAKVLSQEKWTSATATFEQYEFLKASYKIPHRESYPKESVGY